jgi:transposase
MAGGISEGLCWGDLRGAYLFVFSERRKHTIKVLYWDRSEFAMWMKRLEEARFPWPRKHGDEVVKLTPEEFRWLLDGYDEWKVKQFDKIDFERFS